MRGYPQFSFWISITLVKICFSRIFSKPRKNTFELAGAVLKSAITVVTESMDFGNLFPYRSFSARRDWLLPEHYNELGKTTLTTTGTNDDLWANMRSHI